MSKLDNALRILNSIELQNQMAPPDFLGEKVKGEIVDGVADEKFGRDAKHPILCNDVFGEESYLSRLREEGTDAPCYFIDVAAPVGRSIWWTFLSVLH